MERLLTSCLLRARAAVLRPCPTPDPSSPTGFWVCPQAPGSLLLWGFCPHFAHLFCWWPPNSPTVDAPPPHGRVLFRDSSTCCLRPL